LGVVEEKREYTGGPPLTRKEEEKVSKASEKMGEGGKAGKKFTDDIGRVLGARLRFN